jgi:hypothetical protein
MARRFFVNGFASTLDATRCSGSAGTAIADSAIAVPSAAMKPGAANAAAPTAGISGAPKGVSIIATVNGNTGTDAPA